jgi:hypothetical protein
MIEVAPLILQRVDLLQLVYLQNITGAVVPVAEELTAQNAPAMALELAPVYQAHLGGAHIAEQIATLEHDMEFVFCAGGLYVIWPKHCHGFHRLKDRL